MLLQVNYLSHFIITAKLLSTMKQSGPGCRILLMSSMAHQAGSFDINTLNYSGAPADYPAVNYYGRSKLYQVGTQILICVPQKQSPYIRYEQKLITLIIATV